MYTFIQNERILKLDSNLSVPSDVFQLVVYERFWYTHLHWAISVALTPNIA